MTGPRTYSVFALTVSLALLGGQLRPAAQKGGVEGIAPLLDTSRGMVRDSNDDGLPDVVSARVVVPDAASIEEIQGAANIAGRLGFETTAMSFPIVVREGAAGALGPATVPLLVGRTRQTEKLAASGVIDLKALEPEQGLVARVPAPLGGSDGLVVVGADHKGTLAAATELAARLPRVWDLAGVTIGAIEADVVNHLAANGVTGAGAAVVALVVDRDRRGIARVVLKVSVGSPGAATRAAEALRAVHLQHRRGQAPRLLAYANVGETVVELWTGQRLADRATIARVGLNSRTLTPPIDPDELALDSPGARGRAAERVSAPARQFDLVDPYSIDGWYGDDYTDLIPDATATSLVLGDASDAFGAVHVAARLGLETTGISLPIARRDEDVRDAAREASPILFGRSNRLVDDLITVGKVRIEDLQPGEGAIEIVPQAFGEATATAVVGADAAGTEAAGLYLGRRLPYLWDVQRGAFSLSDLRDQAVRFFRGRSGAGQAAQAEREVRAIARELRGKTLESVEATVYLEEPDAKFDGWLTKRLSEALEIDKVSVKSRAVTEPVPVIEETLAIPWEVDEFWSRFRKEVLPRVTPGSRVEIETRLSESPEYRKELVARITAELTKAGAAGPQVRVRSAYKQGFLWLTEEVIPTLRGRGVQSIRIRVAEHRPDLSKDYKFHMVPSRWLHELYPVDEVMVRELGITPQGFELQLDPDATEIYTLEARDAAGTVVHEAAFSPKFVEREYLDKFPGWSRVEVTTGWMRAVVGGETVVDARIATDPERFWDHYQGKILPRIYDNVMKVTDNRPMPDKQPFHRDLDVEIWMSEPDFRIGVDEELISALESLHEDLYFVTLDFYDALGRTTTKRRLAAPGKIFPIIHSERRGQAGTARILYAGNASTGPKIELAYREKGIEKPGRVTRPLGEIAVSQPAVARVVVKADGVREIELRVEASDDEAAARAADALDNLGTLHRAGLFRTSLSYEHVDRIAVRIATKNATTRRAVAHSGAAPSSNVWTTSAAPAAPLVTWDHVIGPDESEELVSKLAGYPQIAAYRAGRSYRGRRISVMEVTLPTPSERLSLAKATAYKPSIFITGRQHANEVSSTSHILRLAELLGSDPQYTEILKKVNVILHPVENPDGAEMAYELQKLTPTHMLHAGRYSALGMDVASQVGRPDPLLPEALVRGRLWGEWLPDIYLNPHGYPSHEWVQQFAGYVPPGFRSYWSSRGWYTGVRSLLDPRYPEHAKAAAAIRESIVREVNANPDVKEMNLRHQARYRRWAFGFAPDVYNQEIYKDTAIYYAHPETGQPSGSWRAGRGGRRGGAMGAWPQVTFFSAGTEAPDETAQGPWLELVTKPGFSFLMAHIRYLRDGRYTVERIEENGERDSARLTMLRVRPVRPPATDGSTTTADR